MRRCWLKANDGDALHAVLYGGLQDPLAAVSDRLWQQCCAPLGLQCVASIELADILIGLD